MGDLAPDVQMKVIEHLIAQESVILEPNAEVGLFTMFFIGMLIGGILTTIVFMYARAKP